MQMQEIELVKVEPQTEELADSFYRVCKFCDLLVMVDDQNSKSCLNLSGGGFYCPFCLRAKCHFRSSRNILVMSFRGIASYYYYKYYRRGSEWMVYASDIETYLEEHVSIGLMNPVFSYNAHTFLWYMDFNLVGQGKSNAPYEEIMNTSRAMFDVFDIKSYFNASKAEVLWSKFSQAIKIFHEQRKRPKDRRMLIPTLNGIAPNEKDEFWDATREFTRSGLIVK